MEQQRIAPDIIMTLYAADDDVVVTARIPRFNITFEIGGTARKQRHPVETF